MHLTHLEFTIIIPTYNRPDRLRQCLQSIAQIDYPSDRFEVIVVDDGSTVPVEDEIALFEDDFTLKLITQKNEGPATARNTGANVARGDILAFTDDDCQLASDWLSKLNDYFNQEVEVSGKYIAVGGQTLNALPNNIYSTASQALVDYLYRHYNAVAKDAQFMTSNNLALPAVAFRAIDGFDETFPLAAAEDRDLCERWRAKGYRLIYASEAIVHHAHRLTLHSFCQQQFNYGRGAFHFHRHSTQSNPQQTTRQPWKFYLDLLHYPFHQNSLLKAFPIALLFVISQFAVAIGLLFESMQSRNAHSAG